MSSSPSAGSPLLGGTHNSDGERSAFGDSLRSTTMNGGGSTPRGRNDSFRGRAGSDGSTNSAEGAPSRRDILGRLNGVFADPEVFDDAADDVAHLRRILRYRCTQLATGEEADAPNSQLAFLCNRYVQRFEKRMVILQKRGGERRDKQHAERHWAARLKSFLNRPFASWASRMYYVFVSLLVLGSCASIVAQSVPAANPQLFPELQAEWNGAELTIGGLLMVDWVLRLIAVCFEPAGSENRPGHVFRFLRQPSTILDFCASFIPAVLTISGEGNSVFQIVSLLRVFRIFFSLRHFDAFEDLEDTIRSSLPSLTGPLIALLVVLVGISSLVYTMEAGSYNENLQAFMVRESDCEMTAAYDLGKRRCPRVESKYLSVVHTMWYTLITFLTVGYGDLVPLTALGRSLGAISIIVGMLFMAMPIAIVGTNFTFTVERLRTERQCVARMMDEANERESLRRHIDEVMQKRAKGLALPSLALIRFLRLNMRMTHLNLDDVPRRLTYFVDVYLSRVVDVLLHERNEELLSALGGRASEKRRPFIAELELVAPSVRPGSDQPPMQPVRHALNLPIDLSIGGANKADVCLSSKTVQQWTRAAALRNTAVVMREPQRRPPPGLKVIAAKPEPLQLQVSPDTIPSPFLAPIHLLLSLVGYGGTVDTVTAMSVEPHHFTLLDANLRECTNLGAATRGGYLVFGKLPPGFTGDDLKDLLHVRLLFGPQHRVFERSVSSN